MNQSLDTIRDVPGLDEGSAQAAASTGGDTREAPARQKSRVLIVDDEENILSSLRRLLRREPYELLSASSGKEAVEVMESAPVHLVITDYRMPGMTGTELLREVQQRWPDTLRIVLSGYSEVKAIISAINDGAVYKFITKPWNDEEIKLNIRRALEQYMLEAENKRMAQEIVQQNERLLELNKLLDQRATDASTGLTCAQELLETVDVGVLTIDGDGLIVGANLRVTELLLKGPAEFMGVTAQTVLPDALYEALSSRTASNAEGASGRFEHDGRTLQWRARPFEASGDAQAIAVAIWEEVPCQRL